MKFTNLVFYINTNVGDDLGKKKKRRVNVEKGHRDTEREREKEKQRSFKVEE